MFAFFPSFRYLWRCPSPTFRGSTALTAKSVKLSQKHSQDWPTLSTWTWARMLWERYEMHNLLQNVPLTKRLTTSLHFPGSLWVMEAHASSNEAWHEWQSHQADSERSFRPFEVCHQPWAEPLRHWDCGKGCLWRDGQAKTTQVGFKQFAALVQRRSFPQNSSSCRGRKNFCLVLCAC